MKEQYLIGIDQSTQGTKALLFDSGCGLIGQTGLAHRQIIGADGWISHDPLEIYRNTIQVVIELIEKSGIDKRAVTGVGISNQRETSLAWNRDTGEPLGKAIVWHCARAAGICKRLEELGYAARIREKTGIALSPYFPAAKIAWLLEHVDGVDRLSESHRLCHGTIDSWLVFCLTGGKAYKTDYSNASRTQLFDITELRWDPEICRWFGIDPANMAEVCDSNSRFGETDFEGFFERPIPIHAVLGDSHAALFGQGCLHSGEVKATYGTGSSVMMNTGQTPVKSSHGLVTSLAWRIDGSISYVLEGNLNYTGAVITWLKDCLRLISSPEETQPLAERARKEDGLYLVPAFSGLGAPYWKDQVSAAFVGMTRLSRKEEFVRASLDCIAYQITDVIEAMRQDSGINIHNLLADGRAAKNEYLMQFQSNILNAVVRVPETRELSGMGVAYMAGIALGLWDAGALHQINRRDYAPEMNAVIREKKYAGWKKAVQIIAGEQECDFSQSIPAGGQKPHTQG